MESDSPTIKVTALGRLIPNIYVNFQQSSPDVCTSGFLQPSPTSSPHPAIGGSNELSWPCSAGPLPLAPWHLRPSLKPQPLLCRWKEPLYLCDVQRTTEDMGDNRTEVSSSYGVKWPCMDHYSSITIAGMRDGGREREETSTGSHLPA